MPCLKKIDNHSALTNLREFRVSYTVKKTKLGGAFSDFQIGQKIGVGGLILNDDVLFFIPLSFHVCFQLQNPNSAAASKRVENTALSPSCANFLTSTKRRLNRLAVSYRSTGSRRQAGQQNKQPTLLHLNKRPRGKGRTGLLKLLGSRRPRHPNHIVHLEK